MIRAAYIKWLKENKQFSFEERPISPFELQRADSLQLVNPVKGIDNVFKYRKKNLFQFYIAGIVSFFLGRIELVIVRVFGCV